MISDQLPLASALHVASAFSAVKLSERTVVAIFPINHSHELSRYWCSTGFQITKALDMHTVKKDQLGWVPVANASNCGMLSTLTMLVDPEAALPRVNWNSPMCVRSQ